MIGALYHLAERLAGAGLAALCLASLTTAQEEQVRLFAQAAVYSGYSPIAL